MKGLASFLGTARPASLLSVSTVASGIPQRLLSGDVVAGVTLAAYAIPVSLAYAGLAGLPPQVGLYGYLLGGLGYALIGSSRQLAIGPTSAISLMIAGTVGAMAGGDETALRRDCQPHGLHRGRALPDCLGLST